jgi:hypothetical protein
MEDWKIEARNDARASKAIRGEQIPSEIQPKIPKPKRIFGMDTFNATTEYVNSLDFRDNALEAQLAKISTNAIQDKLGWKPSTIKSDVTKEMILDYQQEMRKPIVVDGVKFNYHPSTIDIDKVEYEPLVFQYSDAEIATMERDKGRVIRKLDGLRVDLENQFSFIDKLKRDYDRDTGRARDVPTFNAITLAFERRMIDEEKTLEEIKDEIRLGESTIERLNLDITNNERNKKLNESEKVRVAKENAVRLKAYKEDLNQLNKGKLNIEQQPGESDDEFRDRLRDTGMMTYDEDAMSRSAELYNREKMKERMMEIHRDTAMIGNALKSFDADQLFKMNKNWSTLKQNFIKIFGFNSPAVRDRDIVDFFTSQINPIVNAQNSGDLYPVDFLSGEVPEATAVVVDELGGTSEFEDVPTEIGSRELLNFRRRLRDREPPVAEPPLLPSTPLFPLPPTGFSEAEAEAKPVTFPYLTMEKAEQLRVPELQAYLDEVAPKLSKDFKLSSGQKAKVKFLRDNGLIVPSTGTLDPFLRPVQSQSGKGIQPITHDLPKKIQFGKIHISPKKLYYDNILAIRHKSGKSFSGVPDSSVSDKFVSIIMNLLKGTKPSLKDFSTLDVNEKGMYDSLIYMAGLQKEVDNTFNETKNNLKNRLELLEGEIGAGNNNPKLKKELLYLLSKMVKTGMVGGGDAKRYYMSVCK